MGVIIVVIMVGTTHKDTVLMEKITIEVWLLGGPFSVIIAKCLVTLCRNVTRHMGIHLVIDYTEARE